MNKIVRRLLILAVILLTGCAAREFRVREAITDDNLNGTWRIVKAELAGKKFAIPPAFELQISGAQYRAGIPPHADRGKLILFGDEYAGQAARIDVLGEDGPNKGKRYPAIYRFGANSDRRELEICYDLAEKERPAEFVSREGTMLLRVTYVKK